MRRRVPAALAVLVAALGTAVGFHLSLSSTVFNGDLQTGSFTQWPGLQDTAKSGTGSVGSHTTANIVTPAGAPQTDAGDLRVWPDSTGCCATAAKNRVELHAAGKVTITPGKTNTVTWKSYWPKAGNPCQPGWEVFQQWATNYAYNTPSIDVPAGGVTTSALHLSLSIQSGTLGHPTNAAHYPFTVSWNAWHTFSESVTWSRTSNGHVKFVVDGQTVVDVNHQTMPSDTGSAYLKQGVYQARTPSCVGGEQILQGTQVS